MTDIITPPADAIMAPSGPIWVSDDGIIITINNFVDHSHQDAIENLRITKDIAGDKPMPLLVDITKVRNISKEAREEYVAPANKEFVTAVGLLTGSNVGRMIGNLFMSLNKHIVPVKMFTDIDKAKDWLLQHKHTDG